MLVESGAASTREYIYLDGQPLAVLDNTTASAANPSVIQATTPALKNGSVNAAWSNIANPMPYDWVAVYAVGAPDDAYLDWAYTNGTAAGSLALPLSDSRLVPGQSYELRLYANDSYTRLATGAPFVLNPGGINRVRPD